ncbi:hypothetical protein GCM10010319_12530 [Streptomyces blastmyceticus]|uniref:Uncharacterized protein n=1 Tax=Streptomyces blastmyceticus TaxID=68180 RepID=A0ABN0WIS9_9ACTN
MDRIMTFSWLMGTVTTSSSRLTESANKAKADDSLFDLRSPRTEQGAHGPAGGANRLNTARNPAGGDQCRPVGRSGRGFPGFTRSDASEPGPDRRRTPAAP